MGSFYPDILFINSLYESFKFLFSFLIKKGLLIEEIGFEKIVTIF